MTLTTTLVDADGGTEVVMEHKEIRPGVFGTDNDTGKRMSVDNLAALVEST